jgi:ABC-2 type transport system ATP-binding protein
MNGSHAVEVSELVVVRGGRRALDGMTVAVPHGGVTGLLGPSGSGKTTLLRCIIGAQRITAGQVRVLGLPAGSAPLRARIGYVAESPAVYPDITVRENLRYFAAILDSRSSQVDEVMETVALAEDADRIVARLSGGQRARVSLAAALLGAPELLVLDEPTVGLDPVLRRDLWRLFHELAAAGVTLLVSSHVMDEAERCTELLLLRNGRLLASGPPDEIRRQSRVANLEEAFLYLVDSSRVGVGGIQ